MICDDKSMTEYGVEAIFVSVFRDLILDSEHQ